MTSPIGSPKNFELTLYSSGDLLCTSHFQPCSSTRGCLRQRDSDNWSISQAKDSHFPIQINENTVYNYLDLTRTDGPLRELPLYLVYCWQDINVVPPPPLRTHVIHRTSSNLPLTHDHSYQPAIYEMIRQLFVCLQPWVCHQHT